MSANETPFGVIAIDVGGTKIASGLVVYGQDGTVRLSFEDKVPTNAQEGGDRVLERVIAAAKRVAAATNIDIRGIGIGTAGVVDPSTGAVLYANDIMPGWGGQPVAEKVSAWTGKKVAVLGDVQAHALGEARHGCAKGYDEVLCVAAGTGIGGAVISGGKLLRGAHGASGHLGHTLHPGARGMACACGSDSHAESIASGTGLMNIMRLRHPLEASRYVDGVDISAKAAQGDAAAIDVIRKSGFYLGQAIGSWVNAFDPEIVVLSGSVIEAGPAWDEGLEEGFANQAMPLLRETPILRGALGGSAPLLGAAENLLDSLS